MVRCRCGETDCSSLCSGKELRISACYLHRPWGSRSPRLWIAAGLPAWKGTSTWWLDMGHFLLSFLGFLLLLYYHCYFLFLLQIYCCKFGWTYLWHFCYVKLLKSKPLPKYKCNVKSRLCYFQNCSTARALQCAYYYSTTNGHFLP